MKSKFLYTFFIKISWLAAMSFMTNQKLQMIYRYIIHINVIQTSNDIVYNFFSFFKTLLGPVINDYRSWLKDVQCYGGRKVLVCVRYGHKANIDQFNQKSLNLHIVKILQCTNTVNKAMLYENWTSPVNHYSMPLLKNIHDSIITSR